MMIPVAHENMRGRRWPWVTITIIALNFVIFLATNGRMEEEMEQAGQVQFHILLLSAHYPDAHMTPDVAQMVGAFKREHAAIYKQLQAPRRPVDEWDSQIQSHELNNQEADAAMTELCSKIEQFHNDSLAWNYAFHSYRPTLRSYVTADFLHGGWLHIIFNMWFLWLAGTVLEDAWGRIAYPIFYLVSGVFALLVHAAVFPDSFVPVVGASGAIAGLMGGFLARFPKTKIKLMWIWAFGLVRAYRFVPAYIILPLWLVIQVFWGAMTASYGIEAGVAYWAHIGGFAFGMIGAVILRATGLEVAANQAIEAKVSLVVDPRIARATDWIGENQLDAAIAELKQVIAEKPDSIEAHELLLKAQEKRQDASAQRETLATLCRLQVAAGENQTAWNYYEQFTNLGGDRLPRGVWMQLCRWLETEQNWDRAVMEYRSLAEKNPTERASVQALVAAGRICVTKLNRVAEAERFLHAAETSSVPHTDQEAAIREGLKLCAAAAPKAGSYSR
jgi:membrane associated rhomboid family serine protease